MDYKYAYKRNQKELNELNLMIDLDYLSESNSYDFREINPNEHKRIHSRKDEKKY